MPSDWETCDPAIDVHLSMDGPERRGTRMLRAMTIPAEPIGSIPRPAALLEAIDAFQAGTIAQPALDKAYAAALRETIERLEQAAREIAFAKIRARVEGTKLAARELGV